MRKLAVTSLLLGSLLLTAGTARAADTVVDAVKKACHKELSTFCKDVKAGQGRVLACLYAHEDKVSGQCEAAVYDAVEQLEQALAALRYAATECKADLLKYCGDVTVGQGRVAACMKKNEKDLSQRCKDALVKTGLR
jgi:hypothetical protein